MRQTRAARLCKAKGPVVGGGADGEGGGEETGAARVAAAPGLWFVEAGPAVVLRCGGAGVRGEGWGRREVGRGAAAPGKVDCRGLRAGARTREVDCGAAAPGERDYERGSRGWEAGGGGRQEVGCGAAAPVRR